MASTDQNWLFRGIWVLTGVIVPILALVSGLVTAFSSTAAPAAPGFVIRSGNKLMLNGRSFRFSGANIYWGGLDENGRPGLNYPTPFRVNTALQTVAEMGGTVVRCQSCGISTGTPYSVEPALGVFNQSALRHIDYFIAAAQRYGIKLLIPLTGNYSYYLGGYHNFTDWLGLSGHQCPSLTCASAFYTNPRAIAAFELYISVLLNHVNAYTGVPNKDNPTIMSWEVGNEMPYGTGGTRELARWTATIAAYIKAVAPRQLVTDGSLTLDSDDFTIPAVDIQDPHLYPSSVKALDAIVAALQGAPNQAVIIGEYQWNESGLMPFLTAVQDSPRVSGDIYWDLLPLDDDFGFVEHYDGYQLHYPGDDLDIGPVGSGPPVVSRTGDAPQVSALRDHAFAMAGHPVPAYPVPATPAITSVEHAASTTAGTGNLVEWRGAVGAARYIVSRSTGGPGGPWARAGQAADWTTAGLFLDAGAPAGPGVWYVVTAVSPDGRSGPQSPPFEAVQATLDDNLANLALSYSHSQGVTIDTRGRPALYGGDPARAWFPASAHQQQITWRAADLQSADFLAYFSSSAAGWFQFRVSANGRAWKAVPAAAVQVTGEPVLAKDDLINYAFTIDGIQQILPGAAYLQVQRQGNARGGAELGEARISHG
jgi:hypothetical protein